MATLQIEGTFTYAHNQFRDEENPVFLYLYLDRTFAPLHTAHIALNPHEARTAQAFTLQGSVDAAFLPGHALVKGRTARLPADAKLCAQAYVTTRNSYGIPSREDHGACALDLREVHAGVAAAQAQGKAYDTVSSLALHTTRNRTTGVVALKIERITLVPHAHPRRPVPVGFAPAEPYMNVSENVERLSDEIRKYMERFALEKAHFEETAVGSENIVCPLEPSEATILNSELPIPLVGYDMTELVRTDTAWWVQQAEILADRQGYTLPEYAAHYAQLPLKVQAAEAMMLVEQYPQQITYVMDKADGQANEDFGDALNVDSDDCDGLSYAAEQLRRAFVSMQFTSDAATPLAVQPTLEHMQHILSHYTPMLSIAGVSTSHVENVQELKLQGVRVDNAHFAIKYISHKTFARYVRNWNASHPLGHPELVASCLRPRGLTAARSVAALPDGTTVPALQPVNVDALPVLMGEGTGILYPIRGEDPLARERAQLYANAAMSPIKKPQLPPPGGSDFYRVSLIAFTSAFMDTHQTGTFRWVTPRPELEQQGKYSRGALFTDIMDGREDLMLIPFGFTQEDGPETPSIAVPLPPRIAAGVGADRVNPRFVPEFTRQQLQLIRSTVKTRVPPRHFTAAAGPVVDYAVRHSGLDRLCAAAGSPKVGARVPADERTINVYVQPEVADSPRWQAYMETHVRSHAGALIKGLAYAREVHSDTLTRWRLMFRV